MLLAMIGNRFFNGYMSYVPEVGLRTPEQISSALTILGLLTPLLEESLKALPLLVIFFGFQRDFKGIQDGILLGAMVGLGFAAHENFNYIRSAGINSGISIAIAVTVTRSIILGMTHLLWSTTFGIGLGLARSSRSKVVAVLAPMFGLVLGMMIHGLHNASFLWANLHRSYGVPAVVLSLTIYVVSAITWLVFAIKCRRQLPSDSTDTFKY